MNVQESKERVLKALDTMEKVVQAHTGPNGATFVVIFEDFHILKQSIKNYLDMLETRNEKQEKKPGV